MKILWLGALLSNFAGVCVAAEAHHPPALATETSQDKVLDVEFVRSCVYIASGGFDVQSRTGIGTFRSKNYRRFKGSDVLNERGLVWASGQPALKGEVIVFARFDQALKRGVVAAVLPSTPQNRARVEELVKATPTLQMKVEPSQARYAFDEPLRMKWTIKNVSGARLSVFTGRDATDVRLEFRGRDGSSSDALARKRPLTVSLGPGESWQYERVFSDEFPAGTVEISWNYNDEDVLETREALPADLYLETHQGQNEVEILPPTAEQRAALLGRLQSPIWTEQRAAARRVLLWPERADWEPLEAFASHPDLELRTLATQAMVRRNGFSPAVKTQLYRGIRVLDRWGDAIPRNERPDRADLDLARLASNALEADAHKKGDIGVVGFYGNRSYHASEIRDERVGDILAARLRGDDPLAGGINNGVALFFLLDLDETLDNSEKPLPDALKTKVLAAWEARRRNVKGLFTLEQLNAEIAQARAIRYDNFRKGPFYDEIVAILEDNASALAMSDASDKLNAAFGTLPREAAPTLFQVFEWRGLSSPPPGAMQLLADSEQDDAWVRLAQVAYRGDNTTEARVGAMRLMANVDFKRSQPHLEAWIHTPWTPGNRDAAASRLGAALALAARGEKRAVPVAFSMLPERGMSAVRAKVLSDALQKVTGVSFPSLSEWKDWWNSTGSKQEWK